jgi:hypothetical protein
MKSSNTPKITKPKTAISIVKRFDAAQVELRHVMADGLFRPLEKTSIKRAPLFVEHQSSIENRKHPNLSVKVIIKWVGGEALDIFDQSVFLALHKLMSNQSVIEKEKRINDEKIYSELAINGMDSRTPVVSKNTSLTEIANLLGLTDGGENLRRIYRSVHRMASVTCFFSEFKEDGKNIVNEVRFNLLASYEITKGALRVGLNPLLSAAILGGSNVKKCSIDMESQRQLKGDISKRLHVWLSAWASYDKSQRIGIDTLIPHIWGKEISDKELLKNVRRYVRSAITSINGLDGWKCELSPCKKFVDITKPQYSLTA